MAQHDMVIDNGPGAAVRADMNAVVQALLSNSAGPIEPAVTYANMQWLDTGVTPNVIRQRNAGNTAWISPPGSIPGGDAPNDAFGYIRKGGLWVKGTEEAPADGVVYGRRNGAWADAGPRTLLNLTLAAPSSLMNLDLQGCNNVEITLDVYSANVGDFGVYWLHSTDGGVTYRNGPADYYFQLISNAGVNPPQTINGSSSQGIMHNSFNAGNAPSVAVQHVLTFTNGGPVSLARATGMVSSLSPASVYSFSTGMSQAQTGGAKSTHLRFFATATGGALLAAMGTGTRLKATGW